MTSWSGHRARLLALASLLPAALGSAQEPHYVDRLDLPLPVDSIAYPRAVAADLHTGEIFVCDTRRNRIVIFGADGLFSYQIEGGDRFSAPLDLALDGDGYILVLASHGGHRALLELDFDGLFLREIALTGTGETAAEPHLQSLALSPTGARVYLLDTANRRLWVTDREGRVEASADLAPEPDEPGRGDLILGKVDAYADEVLVAVPSAGEIRSFDADGKPTGRTGMKGTGPCRLGFPTAAAVDADGDLVIIDQQRMFILRWRRQGNRCLGEYYGYGYLPGYLYYPMDLALDARGRIYVTQGFQGRVQAYDGLTPAAAVAAPAQ